MVLAYMIKLELIGTAALCMMVCNAGIVGYSKAEGIESEPIPYSAIDGKANEPAIRNGEKMMMPWTDEMILFDFVSDDAVSAWRAVNDTVMGGISSGRRDRSASGKTIFTGEVSLENNGGFASVQGPEIKQPLGEYNGIALHVKGDGKKYKCGLRTDDLFDGISHQASFGTTPGVWQVVLIPFTGFIPTYHGMQLPADKRLQREHIRKLGFLISDRQKGIFRLEIDWIKAYR